MSSDISANDLIFVLFLHLKLTDQINWSWWWVVSPVWIYFLLSVYLKLKEEKKG